MAESDVTLPRAVGRYEVRSLLGRGGFGEVFRAWDPVLRRDVALKRIRTEGRQEDAAARRGQIVREARHLAHLKHPAIVAVHDVIEHEGDPFLVEDYVAGESLRTQLQRSSPTPNNPNALLDLEGSLRFLRRCADALAVAARHGVVHGDLKPENILMDDAGQPHLVDFGLARQMAPTHPALDDPTQEMPHAGGGTPGYTAPEVLRGKSPDPRSDLFSLGVVAYEVMTGRHPFRRENDWRTIASVLSDEPPLVSTLQTGLPPAASLLVARLLAKDPKERIESADALVAETLRLSESLSEGRPERSAPIDAGSARPVGRRAIAAGLAVTLALAVLVVQQIPRGDRAPSNPDRRLILTVQPFRSLMGGNEAEVFALGFTEVLRSRLVTLDALDLFDTQPRISDAIVLNGTLQKSVDGVRVTWSLVDGNRLLRGDTVEGTAEELFSLQDRVSRDVVRALEQSFPQLADRQPVDSRQREPHPEAYASYVRAAGQLSRARDVSGVDSAIVSFHESIARDSTFAAAYGGLTSAQVRRFRVAFDPGAIDLAEAAAARALALDAGTEPAVRTALGELYRATGRSQLAAESFRSVLSHEPRKFDALVGLGWSLYSLNETAAAETTFWKLTTVHPGVWSAWANRGAFESRIGRLQEARRSFRETVRLAPGYARGYASLGGVEQQLGLPDSAAASYQRSIAIEPTAAAHSNLGTLLRDQGRLDDAITNYRRALALDDRDPRVWGNLGSTLMRASGRSASSDSAHRQAITRGAAVLETNPKDAPFRARLAGWRLDIGDRAGALHEIEQCLSLAPESPEVLVSATAVYETVRDRGRARDCLVRALDLGYSPELIVSEPSLAALLEDPEVARAIKRANASSAQH